MAQFFLKNVITLIQLYGNGNIHDLAICFYRKSIIQNGSTYPLSH